MGRDTKIILKIEILMKETTGRILAVCYIQNWFMSLISCWSFL